MKLTVVSDNTHSGRIAHNVPIDDLITIGARDFVALRDFYRHVGWPQVMDDGEYAVFDLRGIVLAVFPLAKLARDGNTEPGPSTEGIRFTIGVQVDTAEEVDRLTEHIHQRPFAPEDRSEAGRWEGGVIIGKDQHSAIGTLVGRTTRVVRLCTWRSVTATACTKR